MRRPHILSAQPGCQGAKKDRRPREKHPSYWHETQKGGLAPRRGAYKTSREADQARVVEGLQDSCLRQDRQELSDVQTHYANNVH